MNASALLGPTVQRALLAAGFALVAFGLATSDVIPQMNPARSREAAWFAGYALLIGAVLGRVLRVGFARALVGFLLLLQVAMVGIAATLGVAVLALAAIGVGSALLPRDDSPRPWLALVVGLGLIAGVLGWLLPYGVHRMPVYWGAAALALVWRRAAVGEALDELASWWRMPRKIGVEGTLAVLVIAYLATSAWLPTAQFDDLTYHLGLPFELATLGHHRFDVVSHVWAVAPWSSDLLHAIPQVLTGGEARGALDTLWYLAILALSWELLARFDVAPPWRWLALALFASQPLLHTLLASMQTEVPSIAAALALAAVVLESSDAGRARAWLGAFAVLLGFLLGLKLTGLFLFLPVGIWFVVRARPFEPVPLLRAAALCAVAGASSYLYAWLLTGNPVFPLMNDVFQSPYFDARRLADARFVGHLGWTAPYDWQFHTGQFQESRDGGAGFQWLALLGLTLPALAWARTRALALCALACIAALYVQMQYLRYLLPALALLGVAWFAVLAGNGARAPARFAIWALVLLNVAALGNSMWLYRDGTFERIAAARGKPLEDDYLERWAPERLLARYLRERHAGNHQVLFLEGVAPFGAELAGRATSDSWYDAGLHERAKRARADASGADYLALFREQGATHVVTHSMTASPALRAALAAHAELEFRVGDAELHRLAPEQAAASELPAPDAWHDAALHLDVATPESLPVIAQYRARLECRPLEGVVAARLRTPDGRSPQRNLDFEKCPPSGVMRLDGWAHMHRTGSVTLELEPGTGTQATQFAVSSLDFSVRPDVFEARDLSGRLRP